MPLRILLSCLVTLSIGGAPVRADDERQAIERALGFLDKDATKWRKEKTCATCHHGTMTVWAFSEARRLGYPMPDERFDDVLTWTKERIEKIGEPRDPRPGWNMVSTPAMYLAIASRAVPNQLAISAAETHRIADHVVRHQESDGSFLTAPPKNSRPPTFESAEVFALLGSLAMRAERHPDEKLAPRLVASRKSVEKFLDSQPRTGTTQATTWRLLAKAWDSSSPSDVRPEIDALLRRQHADGGWGQRDDLASDAYATGQTLYVLCVVGVDRSRPEIERAVKFLLSQQRDDGSWPITPRAQPGEAPAKNLMPITYFASAWATLGLLRASHHD